MRYYYYYYYNYTSMLCDELRAHFTARTDSFAPAHVSPSTLGPYQWSWTAPPFPNLLLHYPYTIHGHFNFKWVSKAPHFRPHMGPYIV